MENVLSFDAAGDLDRKYFLAFLKGLSAIKYKDLFDKVKAAKLAQRQKKGLSGADGAEEGAEEDESMDLEFLYGNLFEPASISPDEFNSIVETGMTLINEIVSQNMTKEQLD